MIFDFEFIRKLYDRKPVHVKALHSVLELLFSAFGAKEKLLLEDDSKNQKVKEKIERLMKRVQKSLSEDWIIRQYTQIFGWPREKKFLYAKEDLEVVAII